MRISCAPFNYKLFVHLFILVQIIPKLTRAIDQWDPAAEANKLRTIDENKKATSSKKSSLPMGIQYNGAAKPKPAPGARAHEWLSPWFESLREELHPVCELVRFFENVPC